MKSLFHGTTAYRGLLSESRAQALSHAMLVLFPDEAYLRPFLRECAKAIFDSVDGERIADLIGKEEFSDCKFYPADGGKWTVEAGAEILSESVMRPVEGEKKLFVLDNFHTAGPLVQNKLLKVLEEPPQGVYFLLGASGEFGVLPTVLSRVKKYSVEPFPDEAIARTLRRAYPYEEGIEKAAAASGGILSAAENLLLGTGEEFSLAIEFLKGENIGKFCREQGERKEKTALLSAIRLVLRDVMFCKAGGKILLEEEKILPLAEKFPMGAALASLELLTETEKQIKFNANFGQALETLAIRMAEEKEKWKKLS